jgi:hypothetical protein
MRDAYTIFVGKPYRKRQLLKNLCLDRRITGLLKCIFEK